MNSDEIAATDACSPDASEIRPGCLLAGGGIALGVVLAVMATIFLTVRESGVIDLGVAEQYRPNSVVYRSTDGLFVVRAADGPVVAFSDVDPHNPPGRRNCRVTFRPDLGQGGEHGRFFDICSGSMYDLSGRGLAGDGLDLRPVHVEQNAEGRLKARPR